jgi:hypothetical protein
MTSFAAAAKFLKYLKRSAVPLFCLFPLFAKSFPVKIEDEIENDILTRARRIRLTSYDRELCNRSFDSYLQNGFYCKVIFNRRFSLNMPFGSCFLIEIDTPLADLGYLFFCI